MHQGARPPTVKKGLVSPHLCQHWPVFFRVPEKAAKAPDLRSSAPSRHGGRMELIKVTFLLPLTLPTHQQEIANGTLPSSGTLLKSAPSSSLGSPSVLWPVCSLHLEHHLSPSCMSNPAFRAQFSCHFLHEAVLDPRWKWGPSSPQPPQIF